MTKEEIQAEERKYPIREFVINIILNRANEFHPEFNKHEINQLMDALHAIKSLIPPDKWLQSQQEKTER